MAIETWNELTAAAAARPNEIGETRARLMDLLNALQREASPVEASAELKKALVRAAPLAEIMALTGETTANAVLAHVVKIAPTEFVLWLVGDHLDRDHRAGITRNEERGQ